MGIYRPQGKLLNNFFINFDKKRSMAMDRLARLKQLLDESPTDDFLLFAIAKEYEAGGDLLAARSHYKQLLRANPEYVGAYYHLGKLHESMENHSEALDQYKRGMTVARQVEDEHSYRELSAAKFNLELELE